MSLISTLQNGPEQRYLSTGNYLLKKESNPEVSNHNGFEQNGGGKNPSTKEHRAPLPRGCSELKPRTRLSCSPSQRMKGPGKPPLAFCFTGWIPVNHRRKALQGQHSTLPKPSWAEKTPDDLVKMSVLNQELQIWAWGSAGKMISQPERWLGVCGST